MPEGRAQKRKADGREARRGIWSGTVTFGLVSIPVALMPGSRAGGPRFRMLGPDGTPLARRWVCSKEETPLDDEDVIRGYEVRDGKWIVVADEELAALEPKRSRDIQLERFVACGDLDPLYFERAYYLVPAGGTARAYALLAHIMEQTGRAGIATFVMHDRAYVVALMARNGILRAETFRFADEVRSPADVGLRAAGKAEGRRVTALGRALEKLEARAFDASLAKADYAARVAALAEKKRRNGEDVVEAAVPEAEGEPVDLMSALRRALGSREPGRRRSPARREGTRRAARKRRGRKRGAA